MLFKIFNKAGRQLCVQKAADEIQAVEFARMYGHRAFRAEAV